jgi:phage terminase Nu1 subunit (DNA packaging protein)
MPLVSIREYGRMRGVSHEAVRKAIESKRLVSSLVQSERGKRKLTLIDSDMADKEWPKGPAEIVDQQVGSARDRIKEPDDKVSATYAQSRAIRESFQARLAKLDFEEKSGKLVDADTVKKQAFKAARTVRDQMMNIPDRVAAELAAETDTFKIHKRLTEEIRKALEGLKIEEDV